MRSKWPQANVALIPVKSATATTPVKPAILFFSVLSSQVPPFPLYPSSSQNTPTMASILSLFPLLILHVLLLVPTKTYSQTPYDLNFTYCAGDAKYTIPSTFASNLDLLLSNLTSSPREAGYFSNTTAGAASSAPAYGLAQCRPDVSASECSTCLNLSATAAAAATSCRLRKSATVRFDYCVLRYSDRRFFGQLEDEGNKTAVNPNTAPTGFYGHMRNLMDEIASQAAARESKFAVGMTNYSAYGYIYELAQCTRDLSKTDCSTCLDQAIGDLRSCCGESVGGRVMKVSCAVEFEIFPFFNLLFVPPPPPGSGSSPDGGNGTDTTGPGKRNNTTKIVLIVSIFAIVALVLFAIFICFHRKKVFRRVLFDGLEEFRGTKSLLFDLGALRAATNNFSDTNKLGEGGFGPVYMGTLLLDGQEIAVKRLSRSSRQGLAELRNEVALVAKLQHRNLVKLLGCCLEEEERLLVYEYLPNTSLDKFLFDPIGQQQLEWGKRYKIIEGIGRGLLYLHEDSRLRIIHRDLKASNILLDGDMNPKISDFGLARLFGVDETQGNTNQIAGTYGYMAPEYALHGLFSTKSDVFSYGVLVLEIVTGRRNGGFQGSGHYSDLLNHVWQQWNEGKASQVIDRSLGDQYQLREVLKCIHIGLLCVQEEPEERPKIATVVLMLRSPSVPLPAPSAPASFIRSEITSKTEVLDVRTSLSGSEARNSRRTEKSTPVSVNDVSITEVEPR